MEITTITSKTRVINMNENVFSMDKINTMVGREIDLPPIETIDKTSIIRYAHALSDSNPLYNNEEYSKNTEYRGIIAPPTFIFDIIPASTKIGEDGRDLTRISISGYKLLRGGNEYEFYEPIRPGDSVSRKLKITDTYNKESKKVGTLTFLLYDITYKNQKQELVGINHETLMFFK